MTPLDRHTTAAEDLARAVVRDAPVEIVAYDPAWPAAFEAERERLAPLLGAEIHHFGSTAVPGLAAKPVIDMIALVSALDAPVAALVTQAGYRFPEAFNATLAHRRFLCYPTAARRTHHLHLVDDREELDRRLRFRDRLRADPVLAGEYVALKRALAERHRDDREAYTEAKGEFVKRHELFGLELRAAVPAGIERFGNSLRIGFEEMQADAAQTRELFIGETYLAHHAMRALRTTYESEQKFVEHVDGVLRPAGYRLLGAFSPDREPAGAVAGFRVGENLAWGHHLYVDDLSTAPEARRQGLARALLEWLIEEGRGLGCGQLHLDSGVGPERFDAHRLYHNHGLSICSHHFARRL